MSSRVGALEYIELDQSSPGHGSSGRQDQSDSGGCSNFKRDDKTTTPALLLKDRIYTTREEELWSGSLILISP